jgi:hypothetical protein
LNNFCFTTCVRWMFVKSQQESQSANLIGRLWDNLWVSSELFGHLHTDKESLAHILLNVWQFVNMCVEQTTITKTKAENHPHWHYATLQCVNLDRKVQDSLVDEALDYRPKGTGFDPHLDHKRLSTWATNDFSMWDNKDLLIIFLSKVFCVFGKDTLNEEMDQLLSKK